jgi:hypothetical protein
MFGPGLAYIHSSPFHPTAVWMTFYWAVVALNAWQLVWKCIELIRDTWREPNRLQLIVPKAFGLIAVLILVNAPGGLYLVLKHPETDLAQYGQTMDKFNHGIHQAFLVVSAIVGLQLAWEIGKAIFERWRRENQVS